VKFVSNNCPKCGAEIFSDAAEGLCTACLLETGLGLFTEAVAKVDDSAQADKSGRISRTMNGAAYKTSTPKSLGDYELLEEIGRGGQGAVYRARQKSLNRTVALKVVSTGHWTTETRLKRFRLEAETAAGLDNPNIVPIYEFGESNESCYFSMKLVEGAPLDQLVRRELLPVRRTAELIAKLARAVHYAHQCGILHRDIKPGNILVDAKGEPHLTDFGLARLTETESTVTRTIETLGTPSYMAPEQALGNNNQVTSATDVYGMGAVLYHLLTGHPPFAGGTTYDTIRLLLETEPRQPRLWNPKIDRDLTTICLKCLEKDPQRRYPSALALAEDLDRWLKHEPIHARRSGVFSRGRKWIRRNPLATGLMASLAALAIAVIVLVWKVGPVGQLSARGIAVLPFENLSHDRDDALFADGIQDDLLTKLAQVRDLKVISRTSVMQYPPGAARDVRQIGTALQVSHVLAGSLRKTGSWLHMNVQLIDTRTDAHVWVEQYDCELKDVFAIQGEIAQKVAEQLRAKISSAEKLAIHRPPTADLTAFNLYSRAKNLLLLETNFTTGAKPNFLQAIDLLNQAVAHDPAFFQAYCQLARAHEQLYLFGIDKTPARLALADTAIHAALRLRPDAGEAHLARAENLYMGYLDYDGALAELATASQTLPNNPSIFGLKGSILRRQGKQEEALQNLEHAVELDPLNFSSLLQLALTYDYLRRYADEKTVLDRALAVQPDDVQTRVVRAYVEFDWKGDTRPLHQLIGEIRATNPADVENVADNWLACALAERDPAGAAEALTALGENKYGNDVVKFSRPFVEGLIARMNNDHETAVAAFTTARAEQEKIVQAHPDHAPALCVLGLIDAALGRKDEALREGRRAIELLPITKDALSGSGIVLYFAMIAAWVGEKDLACEQLARARKHSREVSYGQLKLLPSWDPLRGEPCFEEIVASLAPE
jgi:TolB-like protein/tRNA A-37 threonylcarbamoyl transferase component Bud32/cytochrome c-type biogenesis protein CcmH/NrfG